MSHHPAHRRGQRARDNARGLIQQGVMLACVVTLLSGCMAELQTGQAPAISPPTALPTTAAASLPTANPLPRPPAPGSLAPDSATVAPTPPQPTAPPPTPPPASTAPPPLALPAQPTKTNEERWRAQQQDRVVFDGLVPFVTSGSELWWFDPVNQQHVILGQITGPFAAQAQFRPIGQGVDALEVPYQVNVSYGLTAVSPALLERIAAAGYESDWIETYLFLSPNVTQQ